MRRQYSPLPLFLPLPLLGCVSLLVLVAGCGSGDITGVKNQGFPSYVRLQSDPGDFIGGGKSYEYTLANSLLKVSAEGDLLTVTVDGDQHWRGDFQLPNTLNQIQTGTYANLQRLMFKGQSGGGLSWSGEGRACNQLTGTVVVDKATYDGSTLTAVDLHFDQHCENGTPATHGTIHWKAGDPTKAAGPVNPIPSLWAPPSSALPASGNYVYLASEAGDYIGRGATQLYTSSNSTIVTFTSAGHVEVMINNADWIGDFQAMSSLSQLQVGYYPSLGRFPFDNPVRGGLDWHGGGRGCNTLTGWFAVDQVTYDGTSLTSIAIRFEQHCEGMTPALHGAIRWHA